MGKILVKMLRHFDLVNKFPAVSRHLIPRSNLSIMEERNGNTHSRDTRNQTRAMEISCRFYPLSGKYSIRKIFGDLRHFSNCNSNCGYDFERAGIIVLVIRREEGGGILAQLNPILFGFPERMERVDSDSYAIGLYCSENNFWCDLIDHASVPQGDKSILEDARLSSLLPLQK